MERDQAVRRRRVFYIPGYDPFHPRRYRELYRSEGAAQAALSGYALGLHRAGHLGPYGWQVSARIDGVDVQADIEVLVWSDIVKASMGGGILATYGQLVRTAWAYVGSGALFRLMRLRKGPMIAALYPIVMLLAQLALVLVLAAAVWAGLRAVLPGWGGLGLACAAGVGTTVFGLRAFRRIDHRLFAYYLMHDYAYSAQAKGANPPELEQRMSRFAADLRAALHGAWDEVLVVGHSSGAHLAVSILSDLIRAGLPPGHPPLALLTLGQVVPMVSFLPRAGRLRGDLAFLSACDQLTWVDVTAPGDGCAFALCDPVAVTGVAPPNQRWPLILSAAFRQTLSPERWRVLRWRFFRLHFQYLCAFDRPGDYDYFQITAGPQTLARRYAGRAPSKSRITRAVNRHRGVVP